MKFRSAFLLSILALLAGILGAVLVASATTIRRSATRSIADDLSRGRALFIELQGFRASLLRSEARVVAEEPRLKAVVATEDIDAETAMGVANDLKKALQSEVFILTDNKGRILADTSDVSASGRDASGIPVIEAALASGEAGAVWTDGGQAYQVQARRLQFGTTPVGVVVLGHRLGDRVAEAAFRQTGNPIVIAMNRDPIARSSLGNDPTVSKESLVQVLASMATTTTEPREVDINGVRYLGISSAFPGYAGDAGLRFVILRSLDEAMAPGRSLARLFYGIGAAGFAAAILLAIAIGQRLARPVDQLIAFTKEIAAGRLAERARVTGIAEIAALGDAMNVMVHELSESRAKIADRERLQGEMEIATTIQTALLPRNTEVAGLRIAAAMRPASEVGGDYYEVIPTETGCWLAIGDVAGHGLGAGLVMLMVQTAVLALTRAMPEAKPSEILKALNRALYENIRERLGKDEHVTLTLLRYETNGRLVFAGAHDDFVLYRKSSGRHELVRSPGTWLGAVADISDTSEDQELKLEEGDLLVLYTDGITEAANASREVFGIDRVCATVDRVHAEAPTAIRDELLKEVSGWLKDQQDDMTLVVLSFQGTKLAKTDAMGKETPRGAVSTPPVAVHLGRQV